MPRAPLNPHPLYGNAYSTGKINLWFMCKVDSLGALHSSRESIQKSITIL